MGRMRSVSSVTWQGTSSSHADRNTTLAVMARLLSQNEKLRTEEAVLILSLRIMVLQVVRILLRAIKRSYRMTVLL